MFDMHLLGIGVKQNASLGVTHVGAGLLRSRSLRASSRTDTDVSTAASFATARDFALKASLGQLVAPQTSQEPMTQVRMC